MEKLKKVEDKMMEGGIYPNREDSFRAFLYSDDFKLKQYLDDLDKGSLLDYLDKNSFRSVTFRCSRTKCFKTRYDMFNKKDGGIHSIEVKFGKLRGVDEIVIKFPERDKVENGRNKKHIKV